VETLRREAAENRRAAEVGFHQAAGRPPAAVAAASRREAVEASLAAEVGFHQAAGAVRLPFRPAAEEVVHLPFHLEVAAGCYLAVEAAGYRLGVVEEDSHPEEEEEEAEAVPPAPG